MLSTHRPTVTASGLRTTAVMLLLVRVGCRFSSWFSEEPDCCVAEESAFFCVCLTVSSQRPSSDSQDLGMGRF